MLTWGICPGSVRWVPGAESLSPGPRLQESGLWALLALSLGRGQGCFGLCWAVENEGISPCEGTGPAALPAHPVSLEARHWEAGTRRAVLDTGA